MDTMHLFFHIMASISTDRCPRSYNVIVLLFSTLCTQYTTITFPLIIRLLFLSFLHHYCLSILYIYASNFIVKYTCLMYSTNIPSSGDLELPKQPYVGYVYNSWWKLLNSITWQPPMTCVGADVKGHRYRMH